MLAEVQPLFTTECCIYRVPHEIRKFKEDEYTPKVVSIGPFHHGDSKLLPMEGHKQIYCQKFIEKSRSRSEVSLDDLVTCLQELEPKVRLCYADNIKLSKEELVKVILVDCGFVIEIFLRNYYSRQGTEDDVILSKPWLRFDIRLDLLLLENQLPFFILENLYNLAFGRDYPPFLALTLVYFKDYIGKNLPIPWNAVHFTDLLRTSHLQPLNRRPGRVPGELVYLHSALRIVKDLNTYYKHPLHSKMATLKRDYFDTPWKTIASVAGIALLALTFIQTVFSIIK